MYSSSTYPALLQDVCADHGTRGFLHATSTTRGEMDVTFVGLERCSRQVTADALIALCKQKLADYKVPRQIVLADELPTTPAGKIAKAVLRQSYQANP